MRLPFEFLALVCSVLAICPSLHASLQAGERPDIVLVTVDDMGFSDIGCYGGEVQTPNIDSLAEGGVRLSSFTKAVSVARRGRSC
jgi:arylsulfatase